MDFSLLVPLSDLKLPKIGLVYCVRHWEFAGTIKTVTISKNPDGK
ncbi:IS891/IS1136/IS1341 transposase [Microcystis panniformis FACHB-1757]|uniref:IS891/IS1136/IS1341 transposase n=1 Tax=Microcystis panniformis FACHB-1757 TaxID=1638788 RepID=A0A0K1S2E6_9CHRO|nr:IS891/IS1136/IS1341 transposase [Microcystis panniformis FACHB-1757]